MLGWLVRRASISVPLPTPDRPEMIIGRLSGGGALIVGISLGCLVGSGDGLTT